MAIFRQAEGINPMREENMLALAMITSQRSTGGIFFLYRLDFPTEEDVQARLLKPEVFSGNVFPISLILDPAYHHHNVVL
jgi:hypothetical protein